MIKYYKSQLNNKLIERKIQCTSRECKINKIFVEFYISTHRQLRSKNNNFAPMEFMIRNFRSQSK